MHIFLRKFIIFALLAGLSFGGGVFLAQKKIKAAQVSPATDANVIHINNGSNDQILAENSVVQNEESERVEILASENLDSDKNVLATPSSDSKKQVGVSFAVLGDTQRFDAGNPNGGLQRAVKNIGRKNVSFVMTVGDLLSSCDGGSKCEAGLNQWKNILGGLYSKTYEVAGNHDRTGGDKADALWQRFFDMPKNGPDGFEELAYSFDVENIHIAVLNSEKPDEHIVNKFQRDWLEGDLTRNKKEHTFVFFHEPAYPVSSKQGESLDVEKKDRDALWQILERHKVEAVFNGHEHIASRRKIESVYQFGFGNTDSFDHDLPKAGVAEYSYQGNHFGIVTVDGATVKVEVYSADGKLLNSFDLRK